MMMMISRPTETEYPTGSYLAHYISLVPDSDLLRALHHQKQLVIETFQALPADKLTYRYAPGKWSPLEILGHIIDTERIMAYRALCIARGEQQSLPGFDESAYVESADFASRSLDSLLDEYRLQRETNLLMASHLPEAGLVRIGLANNRSISARAFLWLIAGHERHHLSVLADRYQ